MSGEKLRLGETGRKDPVGVNSPFERSEEVWYSKL